MKRTLTLLFGFVFALGAEAADAAAENYIALKVLNDLIESIEPVDELVTPSTSDYVNLVSTARDAMTNTCGEDNRLVISVEPGGNFFVSSPAVETLRMRLDIDLSVGVVTDGMPLRNVFEMVNVCVALISPAD